MYRVAPTVFHQRPFTWFFLSIIHVHASHHARQTGLASCLESAGLNFVTPGTTDFVTDSLPFNRRFSYTPSAIVFPRSAYEVSVTVKCAGNSGVPVAARSGGHSYAAFGLGGQDGSLVVDLTLMKSITVHPDTTATIQPGLKLGDIALALFHNGGRAMPHGTCPYVGLGGHAGCGGFGLDSRMWGLLLDQTLSAEVVVSNGTILKTSAHEHPDLFWALRGAAPSFGIVTELTFKTHEAPPSNIIFRHSYITDPATATTILLAFQEFSETSAPPELGLLVSIRQTGQRDSISIAYRGIYYGSLEGFDQVISPLLERVPEPQTVSVTQFGWIDSLVNFGGKGTLNTSTRPDGSDTFFVKSLMVPQKVPLTPTAVRAFFDYIGDQGASTGTAWFVTLDLFGGKGSKVSEVPHNATAFAQRHGFYNFQMYASSSNLQPPFPDDGLDFLNNMFTSIISNMPANWNFGAYACYTDPSLSPAEWQEQYYGDHYDKLAEIHRRYNPATVFRYPQAIGG